MKRRAYLERGITAATLSAALAGCIDQEESKPTTPDTPDRPSVDGQWPMARYDPANSGATGEGGPQTKPSVTTLFDSRKSDFSAGLIRPDGYVTAAGEYIYIKQRAGLTCLSAITGEKVWIGWPATLGDDSFEMEYPTPIIINDMIVTAESSLGSDTPQIGVANAATGEPLWSYNLGDGNENNDITPHSACADEDSIYLLSQEGFVWSFSHDGKLLWQINLNEYCSFSADPIHSPILVTDEYLVIAGTNTVKYIINKTNQEVTELSNFNCSPESVKTEFYQTEYDDTFGGTAFADGCVYTAFNAGLPRVSKVDIETRDVIWAQDFSFNISRSSDPVFGPVISDNSVFIYFPADRCNLNCDDNFFSLSRKTGEKRWGNRIAGASYLPVISDDVVYIASSTYDGAVDTLNLVTALSKATGRKLWSVEVDGTIDSNFIVSNGSLFVFTRNPENIYSLS